MRAKNAGLRLECVPVHTQSLLQSGFLYLLSHEVVPAVAALPYQPNLMTQDWQVAHEADRCHGPGKRKHDGYGTGPTGLERKDEMTSSIASETEELSTEEEGASLNDKVT